MIIFNILYLLQYNKYNYVEFGQNRHSKDIHAFFKRKEQVIEKNNKTIKDQFWNIGLEVEERKQ